jgi:hypothetical protein
MKTKKRFMVVGGIILGMLLSGAAAVEAWGPGGWRGCGGWFHHGFHGGKDMPDAVLRHMDKKVGELNLTAAQKVKYDELRASIKTHLSEAVEDHKALRESLYGEMAKEVPDVAVLVEKMKVKVQDVSTIMQKNMNLAAAFYGSLDDNQKKQVVSEIKKRMAKHSRWEGRRGR